MKLFDVEKWARKMYDEVWALGALHSLADNYEALVYPSETEAEDYQEDVRRAVEIHLRQMIVLVVTYLEGIIVEFMECLFTKHPPRMYAYLIPRQERGLRGKVDLKDILSAESKEALVTGLTRRAASIATQGGFRATVNSLERVSKTKLDASLLGDITSLVEQRNRIVHEASSEEVGEDRVRQGFGAAVDLLRELVRVASENEVPCKGGRELIDEYFTWVLEDLDHWPWSD